MKALQTFSDDYLEQCKKMSPDDILKFLESFRLIHAPATKSKLISMKIQEPLLQAFRKKCDLEGIKYQTQIKLLMQEWLTHQINSK